jgi:predicted amidophosphoribosyltransferase
MLVPIPLHWHKEHVRGFNQSIEVGKVVASGLNWKFVPDLLIKKEATISQAELGGDARRQNLKNVFVVNPNHTLNSKYSVLIFDDVVTTGSTLVEACRVLKKAGVQIVWGLTIAR